VEPGTTPTGLPSFDSLLGGGHAVGDNIVWITQGDADALGFARAFLREPVDGGLRRHVPVGTGVTTLALGPGVDEAAPPSLASTTEEELEARILADDVDDRSRIVVSGFDDLAAQWGADRALDFYARTCPRLFDRGAVAYWLGRRDRLGATLIDGVTRIAQSVFELRDGKLRVVKVENRPTRLQGALVDVETRDGEPVVGREHVGGRVGEGLRRLRRERNLTQGDVAALADVTPAAISQAESGRRGLSLDTLVRLCERLGIGVDDLLGTGRPADPAIARRDRHRSLRGNDRTVALFDDPSAGPPAYRVRLEPGGSGRPPFHHKGPELVVAVAGLVLVDLGETTPVLRAGDSLLASRTHIRRWSNLGGTGAELLWVATGARTSDPDGPPDAEPG
jgi:transcriptional regulator with XRE-family HTH domain